MIKPKNLQKKHTILPISALVMAALSFHTLEANAHPHTVLLIRHPGSQHTAQHSRKPTTRHKTHLSPIKHYTTHTSHIVAKHHSEHTLQNHSVHNKHLTHAHTRLAHAGYHHAHRHMIQHARSHSDLTENMTPISSKADIADTSVEASSSSIGHFPVLKAVLTEHLNPHVYSLAIKAYERARARHEVTKPYLAIIDYSMPSSQKRFWVIDLAHHSVPFYTYVAHGQNSGDLNANAFSNYGGSHQSSIGAYSTANTYFGHKGLSLRLKGLESGINDKALSRAIVLHGADYVSDNFVRSHGRLGRSWGCPAVSTSIAGPMINTLKNGSMIFAYYPSHQWLSHSRYLL